MRQSYNANKARFGVAAALLFVWVVVAGVGGPYFGKIDEVASNDLATFLPKNAESTRVREKLEKFVDSSTIPLIAIFESDNRLTQADTDQIADIRTKLSESKEVADKISPAVVSDDGKAAFVIIPLDSNSEFQNTVPLLQQKVADAHPTTKYSFSGPAMFSRDLNKAFAGIDGTLLFVALGVVLMILLIIYRSPLLPIVTLMGAIVALSGAIVLVWHLANAGIVQLNGQVQGILFILVIGAATDYSLLYIARYYEELMRHKSTWRATVASWKASLEPIVAAGGTVTLGLLCLLVSDLGSNKALGPVGGIGILFSVLVALTFLPAALLLLGRAAFWPRRPRYIASKTQADYHTDHPLWNKIGKVVSIYPRKIWIGTMIVLLAACTVVPQLKATGVSQENLILGSSQARDGQAMLSRHFPSGEGSPVVVVVPQYLQDKIVQLLDADKDVTAVTAVSDASNMPQLPLGKQADSIRVGIRHTVETERAKQIEKVKSGIRAQNPVLPNEMLEQIIAPILQAMPSVDELAQKADPFKDVRAKVRDGEIVLQATLRNNPSSPEARRTIERLRADIVKVSPGVMVGGVSAVQYDTNSAADRDITVIIPLILLAITVILMLLLRSIVAPMVLLATTIISFGATLGISALLFNNVWKFPGADPSVVIFGFVFLVALGIDYNIFLMTRVREETLKLGMRAGTLKALIVTGGVITSAGIVLAATFAALYVIPILFLAQIAFIVAFGVLLDTLIVRSLLVPALTLEIGKRMWWPSRSAQHKAMNRK